MKPYDEWKNELKSDPDVLWRAEYSRRLSDYWEVHPPKYAEDYPSPEKLGMGPKPKNSHRDAYDEYLDSPVSFKDAIFYASILITTILILVCFSNQIPRFV